MWVRLVHGNALYMAKYGMLQLNKVMYTLKKIKLGVDTLLLIPPLSAAKWKSWVLYIK